MFLVKTYLDRSAVHGIGVFAAEEIPAGTILWRELPGFDVIMTVAQVAALPEPAKAFMDTYSYYLDGVFHLNVDHAKFTNHDDDPNTRMNTRGEFYAVRPITRGEEITADYREFSQERPRGLF